MLVRNQRVDVNCFNHRQETPLLLHFKRYGRFLSIGKQLRIIEALLSSPFIGLNHRDKDGRSAIWHAMDNSNPWLAELLLQQVNMDSNCIDKFGQTPLAQAAENGFLPLVELHLRDPRLDISPRCADAVPPLWSACRAGHYSMVNFLLQNSADINQRSPTGTTPLWIAIAMEHVNIVHLLLSYEETILE